MGKDAAMNLEHYKNFVSIVDCGTISGASKELMIAQPALSNQVKNLEDYYGAQLLVRNPRHVELTDAGRILYDKIKAMTYLEESAQQEIKAVTSGDRGTIWFGISPTWPDEQTQNLLLDFHRQYPDIQFRIEEKNSDAIVEQVRTGQLEIALVRGQAALPPEVQQVMTLDEHLMVYFRKDHPQLSPSMQYVPVSFLRNQPLSISRGLLKAFNDACRRTGFEPDFVSVSASRYSSILWAEDGKTICIMAGREPGEDDQFCWREIAGHSIRSRRMFVMPRFKTPSAVTKTFLDFCRNYASLSRWSDGAEN